ncbi:hypothetical protein HPB51_018212 [Rhipicephalus microplus]|uniref:Uncharacterized protein n=1 Tax=Rhipicephalus microplus TaxID=6941 RepID=A0A9J6E3C2_RHIMP|nr:hypothetical protein HPB51_018212 [Rhipicephalus microplus]
MSNAESSTKPLQRTGHVATAYKNGVLVWGGYRETERTTIYLPGNELWFYDTFLEKWNVLDPFMAFTPLPHLPMKSQALRCLENAKQENVSEESVDGRHEAWRGTSHRARQGAVAQVLGDAMYLFGGFLTDRNTNQLYRLDLTTLTWELVDAQGDLPIPCDKMAGWTYRDWVGTMRLEKRLLCNRNNIQTLVTVLRGWSNQLVAFNTQTNSWSWPMYKGTAPVARAAHAAARIDGQVFIFGGRHQQIRLNDIHRLDLTTMHWTGVLRTIGEKPRGRSWHSFTALPPFRIVLYGGFSQTEEPLSDCWLFVVPALTWVRVEVQLPPRLWHSACLSCELEVIVFGGCARNIFQQDGIQAEDTVITLSFSPRSLYRICLERALRLRHVLQSQWPMLPPSVRDTLYLMHGNTQGSRLDGS